MSIKIMSAIFESDLPPTKRLIMLALADHANDEGVCYPSISRLCRRTGLRERAVQTNIKELVASGHLKRDMNAGQKGSNLYVLTPAPDAPPQEMHPAPDAPTPRRKCAPTPAPDAPEPSGNHQEPSGNNNARAIFEALAEWASPDPVRSFIAYRRKQKGKALSLTAAKRQAAQLQRIFQNGGDTDDALGLAEERGWQSVQADWYFKAKGQENDNRNHQQIGQSAKMRANRPDPALEQIARLAGLGQSSGYGGG